MTRKYTEGTKITKSTGGGKAKVNAKGGKGKGKGRDRDSDAFKPGKRRPVKEVVFDEDARKEYLTGFSKRKNEKKEAARKKAVQREKEERLEMRKQLRDNRKARAEENVRKAREFYGDETLHASTSALYDDDDDDEDEEEEVEYSNEEMTTTVQIEDFTLPGLESAPSLPTQASNPATTTTTDDEGNTRSGPSNSRLRPKPKAKPTKPKRIPYIAKGVRAREAAKQKVKQVGRERMREGGAKVRKAVKSGRGR